MFCHVTARGLEAATLAGHAVARVNGRSAVHSAPAKMADETESWFGPLDVLAAVAFVMVIVLIVLKFRRKKNEEERIRNVQIAP